MKRHCLLIFLGALSVFAGDKESLKAIQSGIQSKTLISDLSIATGETPWEFRGKKRKITDRFMPENMEVVRDFIETRFRKDMKFGKIESQKFPLTDYREPYKKSDRAERGEGINYWVTIPGEKKPQEIVTLLGHYDTTGKGKPGANDNGTGFVSVLSIAEAFKKAGIKPRRTIRFLLTDGEEIPPYFQGAHHFFDKSTEKGEKNVLVINLDQTGFSPSGESLGLYSGKYHPKAAQLLKEAAKSGNLKMKVESYEPYLSDNLPAVFHDIPAVAIFEQGTDKNGEPVDYHHYHRKTDSLGKVNPEYAVEMARWGASALYLAAQSRDSYENTKEQRAKQLKNIADGLRDDEEFVTSAAVDKLRKGGCPIRIMDLAGKK